MIDLNSSKDPVSYYLESRYKWILDQLSNAYNKHITHITCKLHIETFNLKNLALLGANTANPTKVNWSYLDMKKGLNAIYSVDFLDTFCNFILTSS